MYKALLVFENEELMRQVQYLRVWGTGTEFEIFKTLNDGEEAYQELKKRHYDLVLTEIKTREMDGLKLLRMARREKLCDHIVLCSEKADFDYARQGIILGAFDYMVSPFEEDLFFSLLNRVKNQTYVNLTIEINHSEEILGLFKTHDSQIYTVFPQIADNIYNETGEIIQADKMVRNIYEQIIEGVYEENEWLELYKDPHDFYALDGIQEADSLAYRKFYGKNIIKLYEFYNELFPKVTSEQIKEVIAYILDNPESDIKERDMALKMYMNVSYFSTAFVANTGKRFVDYLLNVRLMRAAYLLKSSKLKVSEISMRLNYKDTAYFSRLFRKKYGVTPSEYRMSDNLEKCGGCFYDVELCSTSTDCVW